MTLIRYIFSFIIRLALGVLVAVVVWWLITALFPAIRIRNFISFDTKTGDLFPLPPPGSFKGLLAYRRATSSENEFVPLQEFNGYGLAPYQNYAWSKTSFVTYTSDGVEVVTNPYGNDTNSATTVTEPYAQKELYVRNLSIYQGGLIYNGLAFGGEARETFFQNGRFPVIIADLQGRPIAISYAYMTNTWSPPGWKRFQVQLTGALPDKAGCLMVFESGNRNADGSVTRTAIPMVCSYK
jgi:hypothetical protein